MSYSAGHWWFYDGINPIHPKINGVGLWFNKDTSVIPYHGVTVVIFRVNVGTNNIFHEGWVVCSHSRELYAVLQVGVTVVAFCVNDGTSGIHPARYR